MAIALIEEPEAEAQKATNETLEIGDCDASCSSLPMHDDSSDIISCDVLVCVNAVNKAGNNDSPIDDDSTSAGESSTENFAAEQRNDATLQEAFKLAETNSNGDFFHRQVLYHKDIIAGQ